MKFSKKKLMTEILMAYLWEKYEKMCQNLYRIIYEIPWHKIPICNMFRKLNTSTTKDIQKVKEDYHSFTKKFGDGLTSLFMTWVFKFE